MLTKLDIINHLLNVVGESPVTSPNSQHPTAISAVVEIDRVDLELQEKGWWFNRDKNLILSPNEAGEVVLPSNTLSVDPVNRSSQLVQRGSRFYDPLLHTYALNRRVTVNLISRLEIDELPAAAAIYIQHQAAYDFYVNDDADEEKANRLQERVLIAKAALQNAELRAGGYNAFDRTSVQILRAGIGIHNRGNPNWPGGRR